MPVSAAATKLPLSAASRAGSASPRIAERRGLLEPLASKPGAAGNAVTFVVDHAEPVHAGGVVQRGAQFEQPKGLGIVAPGAFAAQIGRPRLFMASGSPAATAFS